MLLYKGGRVVTYSSSSNQLINARLDVLIDGETIAQVGENLAVPEKAQVIDATDSIIIPGFVDVHRHVYQGTLTRSALSDRTLREYLPIWPFTWVKHLTADHIYHGELSGLLEAQHCGVTTILDHFNTPWTPAHFQQALKACRESGSRVVICYTPVAPPDSLDPPNFDSTPALVEERWNEFFDILENRETLGNSLVEIGLGLDVLAQTPEDVMKGIMKKVTPDKCRIITSHFSAGPTAVNTLPKAIEYGILDSRFNFSHAHCITDSELAALKKAGASIATTPEDEPRSGLLDCVAFPARDAGVHVGIGIDSTSMVGGDMFTAMRTLLSSTQASRNAELAKTGKVPLNLGDRLGKDAFRMATLGGAETLNLQDKIGTIEAGKQADLVVLKASSPSLIGYHPDYAVNAVVFNATVADIADVLIGGRFVKRNHQLTSNWKEIGPAAQRSAQNFQKLTAGDDIEAAIAACRKYFWPN